MLKIFDAIVIGGGQAGLAAGYHLKRQSLSFCILDASPKVGGSWQHYYDSLKLLSPARYSSLPGLQFPGSLAVRTPVQFTRQRILGKDLHFWMRVTGIDTLPLGYWNKVPTPSAVIDAGNYEAALQSSNPDQRPMFGAFHCVGNFTRCW